MTRSFRLRVASVIAVAVGFGVIIISGPASAAPSNVRTPSQTTAPTSTTATHHVVVTDDWWW